MGQSKAEAGTHAAETDAALFAARLTPHRSLTRANFRILLAVFSAASFVSTLPFVLLGAWPVAGFMGLDVLIFYLAFRASFRSARAYEDVVLTPFELLLAKVTAKGFRAEYRFNPVWTRLQRDEHEEYGITRLAFVSRGRAVEVAGFLGPAAKADLATDLTRALADARRGPRYS